MRLCPLGYEGKSVRRIFLSCPGLYANTNYPGYRLGLYFRIQDRRVKPSLAWDSDGKELSKLDLRSPTTIGRKSRKMIAQEALEVHRSPK
ncbi:MAG: hypothetical protein AAB074_15200 [Planctomycetota bacterium]